MAADIPPPVELARFIDAQGHRVKAVVTRSGLLAVLTQVPGNGLSGGHPCLNAENAVVLRDALTEFIDGPAPVPPNYLPAQEQR
jgi:hypothetical protein